jgi:hypothetical protein
MSSLWTPGGERPVSRPPQAGPETVADGPVDGPGEQLSEAEVREQMEELRDQLAATPADVVVANHAYGLFELAALHLSLERPQLDEARLAIDALGFLVEGLGPRLGPPADELSTALGQLRMAFVQVQAALAPRPDAPGGGQPAG